MVLFDATTFFEVAGAFLSRPSSMSRPFRSDSSVYKRCSYCCPRGSPCRHNYFSVSFTKFRVAASSNRYILEFVIIVTALLFLQPLYMPLAAVAGIVVLLKFSYTRRTRWLTRYAFVFSFNHWMSELRRVLELWDDLCFFYTPSITSWVFAVAVASRPPSSRSARLIGIFEAYAWNFLYRHEKNNNMSNILLLTLP